MKKHLYSEACRECVTRNGIGESCRGASLAVPRHYHSGRMGRRRRHGYSNDLYLMLSVGFAVYFLIMLKFQLPI